MNSLLTSCFFIFIVTLLLLLLLLPLLLFVAATTTVAAAATTTTTAAAVVATTTTTTTTTTTATIKLPVSQGPHWIMRHLTFSSDVAEDRSLQTCDVVSLGKWFVTFPTSVVEHVRNVMAHAQKPDLVFQRNGRVHLNWTAILTVHEDPTVAAHRLQMHLNKIQSWLKTWRMKANEAKSVRVTFTLNKMTCPPVKLNNDHLP